jgi:hypothetical protein
VLGLGDHAKAHEKERPDQLISYQEEKDLRHNLIRRHEEKNAELRQSMDS